MTVTKVVRRLTEQELGALRDTALKLLQENQSQTRDGIEMLVRERLNKTVRTIGSHHEALLPEQIEALYQEMLDLSFVMFSLGYTMAHTLPKASLSRT